MKIIQINIDDKNYNAAITNYSLSVGEKLGLLKGSQLSNVLTETNMLSVIYLALLGVEKNVPFSFTDFTKIEWDEQTVKAIYRMLIEPFTTFKENNFAKEIEKNISKIVPQNAKQIKPLKLNFECVEDRYTIYCLVYGIDSEIFWHSPIMDVERIFENIQTYRAWQARPREVR